MALDKIQKDKLRSFLWSHHTAVLATIKKGNKAHATTIYYLIDEHFNFYFITKDETLKFKNIEDNNSVALAISDEHELQTVQVEGTAEEIKGNNFAQTVDKLVTRYSKEGGWDKLPINQIKGGAFRIHENSAYLDTLD